MSRVGKYPVLIPEGVDVTMQGREIIAKGKLGEQIVRVLDDVKVRMQDNEISVILDGTHKRARQAWGTTRALIQNAVSGVSEGFVRKLEVNGVGYRAQVKGNILNLQLGFSHDIDFPIPEDVKIAIEGDRNNVIAISGVSKQRVGQVASNIRGYRPPEPYKGKGVKYMEEVIVRKEGKKK